MQVKPTRQNQKETHLDLSSTLSYLGVLFIFDRLCQCSLQFWLEGYFPVKYTWQPLNNYSVPFSLDIELKCEFLLVHVVSLSVQTQRILLLILFVLRRFCKSNSLISFCSSAWEFFHEEAFIVPAVYKANVKAFMNLIFNLGEMGIVWQQSAKTV